MFKRLDFPIITCAITGIRQVFSDRRFLSAIIGFPMIVGAAVLIASDILNLQDSALWLGIIKVPDDFVRGITLAVYVRYLLFKQLPAEIIQKDDAQSAIALTTAIFTLLGLLFAGIVAFLSNVVQSQQALQEAGSAPEIDPVTMVASGFGLVGIIWLFRYQWLPIAAAAGMDIKEFAKNLGYGLGLPLRVFGLWFACSIPAFIIMSLFGSILANVNGGEAPMDTPLLWLLFVINAIVTVITVMIQTAASVHAIRFCMGHKGLKR